VPEPDLLTLNPAADGTWTLSNNDVAVPGAWHADVIVRRHDTADDAQAGFSFSIDPTTGQPSFSLIGRRGDHHRFAYRQRGSWAAFSGCGR
jgi:hypothetical protein